jgi:hypothetical protein
MRFQILSSTSLLAAMSFAGGCTQTAETPVEATAADDHPGHSQGGWWCDEHGVPESVCGLCNSKLAAEFQKKGDWCEEHDRPDSQCFACHPELEARFAAQYEAKFGEKPPKPEG